MREIEAIGTLNYSYTDYGPSNGKVGAALADRLVGIVSEMRDVNSVCDLGCGNGYLAGLLADRNLNVVGVDGSQSGIDLAVRKHGGRCTFLRAEIDAELPSKLKDQLFDLVISSDVIEHMLFPRNLLRCARILLRPGGVLVVGTPYHGYLKNVAISFLGRWDAHHGVGWDGGHVKFFSVATLSGMVEECGFAVKRFAYFGRCPLLWMNMICIANVKH